MRICNTLKHKEKKMKKGKRHVKRVVKLSMILLGCISLIALTACGKKTNFTSIQDYVDAGGYIYTDVPQSATDIQYYLEDRFLLKHHN